MLIRTLKVSCQKATELMERRDFHALRVGEAMGLWFHMRICDGCKTYERQRAMLDKALMERLSVMEDTSELESRILGSLRTTQ